MKARNISICNRRTKWARPQHPQPFTLTRAQEVRPVPPFSMHPFPAQNPLQYALAGRQSCTRLLTTCDFSLSCSLLAFTFRSAQQSIPSRHCFPSWIALHPIAFTSQYELSRAGISYKAAYFWREPPFFVSRFPNAISPAGHHAEASLE